jgi:hypothetical protein
MFAYKTDTLHPISEYNYFTVAQLLLNEVRTFASDINMVSSIAANRGAAREINETRIKLMPIVHCIDHHSFTDIALYVDPQYVQKGYPEFFGEVWRQVTGMNPRRGQTVKEDVEFVRAVRQAQYLVWIAKSGVKKQQREITSEQLQIDYKLDVSWIAGLVGTIEIGRYLVTVRPDDILRLHVIRKPSRGDKTYVDLTEEERDQILEKVHVILRNGYKLKVPSGLPQLQGAIGFLTDRWTVSISGQQYEWSDVCNTSRIFSVHSPIETNLYTALTQTGEGIASDAMLVLSGLMQRLGKRALQRLMMYIGAASTTIEMFKISRDGSGQEYAVVPEDTAVFHFLAALTVLFPGVISLDTARSFIVRYGPGLWWLRDYFAATLRASVSTVDWKPVADRRQRVLWEHQLDSVAMLKKNRKSGHLIWIPVGLGKTLIVLTYLQYLIEQRRMPLYCVYTCPPSAVDNTLKELADFGFSVNQMDLTNRGTSMQKTLQPLTVNLILHDHLRLTDEIVQKAADVFFINDEFHKTLNTTQRTTRALEIARLSSGFIGLSGTIVQNENVEDLIQWLNQIVEFEVTVDNFWVAVGAMVSKKVMTNVIIDRHDTEAIMSPEQLLRYRQHVSVSLGGVNERPSVSDFKEAVSMCRDICTEKMISLTIESIQKGDRVFLVAKDMVHQQQLKMLLNGRGLLDEYIFLIGKGSSLTLRPEDPQNYWVVITTLSYSAGYTLTKLRVMITTVYFSNEATREQLEGRINRIGQPAKSIDIYVVHTGILSYVLEKYNRVRSMADALKGFADTVNVPLRDL